MPKEDLVNMNFGKWFYVILAGTKKEKAKDKRGSLWVQQLIIKTWRYGSVKEAWESGQETARNEELGGSEWLTDIRIEVRNGTAETYGEFTRLYKLYQPQAAGYIERKWEELNQPHIQKHVAFDDPISLGRSANFILSIIEQSNSSSIIEIFRKKNPDIQFWVSDSDLHSMMKCCISDALIEKFDNPNFAQTPAGKALGVS